jgi:glycerol-1-phosphate dehydrogenase [NAD(P)+]
MTSMSGSIDRTFLNQALEMASDTRRLEIAPAALAQTGAMFQSEFGASPAVIVADSITFAIAGKAAADSLKQSGQRCRDPFIFAEPNLPAESRHVDTLHRAIAQHDAVPIAIGGGTINDLTKLAAHRAGRPYMAVATAASMDGYTAYGASITHEGSKQTFDCPAPRAVLADLDVIAAAPPEMNAAGYADLLAKISAGADWIVADALDVEAIDPRAWEMVQGRLRDWISDPAGVAKGDQRAIAALIEGLIMSGFAMQRAKTSRPASGAEHQFSHLWDMQHHTHDGAPPAHGFKVGIGTLASAELYDHLMKLPLDQLDVDRLSRAWPTEADTDALVAQLFEDEHLRATALTQTRAKSIDRSKLREHLERLRQTWPNLRARLQAHLLPPATLRDLLAAAGTPTGPEQIGISRPRLRDSYRLAYHIRQRYTVLDLAVRAGLLDQSLEHLFGPAGPWPIAGTQP